MSLNAFLNEQKYTDADKRLIKATIKDPKNLTNLINIHQEDLPISIVEV